MSPSPTLWDSVATATATDGRSNRHWSAETVSIDSRSLEPGALFIALQGPSFDGHDFVAAAFERGASAAMVHRVPGGLPDDAALLEVADTLRGLRALGVAARERTKALCLGITGSVGKTSSKEMLRAALATGGRTYASAASHNNHWGVPLSLARMPLDSDFGVFEMGMNHAGEIRDLVSIVRPRVALITQIAPAHIAYFADGLDGIAAAKAEIFEGLEPGGVAVINNDAPRAQLLKESARRTAGRILTFGASEASDFRLIEAEPLSTGSLVKASAPDGPFTFKLGLPGKHMALNALGVLAAASAVGLPVEAAAGGLAELSALKGRGARQEIALQDGGSIVLIDEGYNANPVSVKAAIALLQDCNPKAGGRRLAVLGDMLELGDHSAEMHAGLAEDLVSSGTDLVFTCGREMEALQAALPHRLRGPHRATSEELAPALLEALRPDDIVLVKGSLGSRMARIVDALLALTRHEPSQTTE